MVNGLGKIAWAAVFRLMSPCLHVFMSPCPCLKVSGIPQTENKTTRKRQLQFLFCKQKTETTNFRLLEMENENGVCFPWSANEKQ
jgi:hypothetical protein